MKSQEQRIQDATDALAAEWCKPKNLQALPGLPGDSLANVARAVLEAADREPPKLVPEEVYEKACDAFYTDSLQRGNTSDPRPAIKAAVDVAIREHPVTKAAVEWRDSERTEPAGSIKSRLGLRDAVDEAGL